MVVVALFREDVFHLLGNCSGCCVLALRSILPLFIPLHLNGVTSSSKYNFLCWLTLSMYIIHCGWFWACRYTALSPAVHIYQLRIAAILTKCCTSENICIISGNFRRFSNPCFFIKWKSGQITLVNQNSVLWVECSWESVILLWLCP